MFQESPDNGWIVTEFEFDLARLHHHETVFTLGNGYLSTRGAFEEGFPGSRPATLIHGVFDDVPIAVTELANCPDWLPLNFLVDGERFRMDQGEVLGYQRCLDLRRGLLTRELRWRSPSGRTVALQYERFASLVDPHVLVLRCRITPEDSGGLVQVRAGLNGYPDNLGLKHWEWMDQGGSDSTVWLHSRTRHSAIDLGMAARISLEGDGLLASEVWDCQGYPTVAVTLQAHPDEVVTLEKAVTVFTSRDASEPARAALEKMAELAGWVELLADHEAAWAGVWRDSDVLIEGDAKAQMATRYNLFQLLIAAPRHDDRVSIPAKTLSGFGYKGHVFWDTELFALPIFTYTQPKTARNLLTYRYRNLAGARRKAQENGFEGAMFPWESADTGDEVTPRWVPGPKGEELVRIWTGDIELHISTDVAYGVWHYWRVTGDDDWMRRFGAEIILDTAVFWGSRVEYDKIHDWYEISDVIGPDEYHEHVDNNAFTNRMVQWHLESALKVLEWLRQTDPAKAVELESQLGLTLERLLHWEHIIARMRVLWDQDSGLYEQFEGYFELADVDLDDYEPRTQSMQAVLGIEGANQSQVLKQPDVLMLLYLLRDQVDRVTLQTNWDYYAPRTDHTHGSSLGPAIHAILACDLGKPEEAYRHFMRAALVDLEDVRGNTADGIHAASAGAVWQALVMGFGGLRLTGDGPVATPRLPPGWKRLKFRVHVRGVRYEFDLTPDAAHVSRITRHVSRNTSRESRSTNHAPDIRGVIFDLDGVLTDTSELHYQGWQRLADEEGLPFDRQANEALRGMSRRDSLMLILDGRPVSEERMQELMARKNRYYVDALETLTPDNLLPGALDLLDEVREAGLCVAVGSASKNARTVIERLDIGHLVDAVSDGHSVEQQKPAPDLFLHAAAQLGVAPEACLVVEDAASGVEAGLAAGMWTLGLGPQARVGSAHVVMPSLRGVHWSELREQLSAAVAGRG